MIEELFAVLGFGAFGLMFMAGLLISVVEIVGKIYATYDSLIREDLTGEQRIIYLAITWFIPFGWAIYLLLGKEKTADFFSDVKFL